MQQALLPLQEKPPAKVAPYHGTPSRFHSAWRISFFLALNLNHASNLGAAPKLRKKFDLPLSPALLEKKFEPREICPRKGGAARSFSSLLPHWSGEKTQLTR
jgi:hypothetical protein